MKVRIVVLGVGALCFLLGFFTATHIANSYSGQIEHQANMRGLEGQADIARRSLEYIRAGNTNVAIGFLEGDYDTVIALLGKDIAERPHSKWDENVLISLRQAKEYRGKFPRKSGMKDIDEQIAQAFSLLDQKQK